MQLSQIQNFKKALILNFLTKNGNGQNQKTTKTCFLRKFYFQSVNTKIS